MGTILSFFPAETPREKQIKALNFIEEAVNRGFQHIMLAAPTGVGKSFIGVAACRWMASNDELQKSIPGQPGGYYLVGQKLLQDQLEQDHVGQSISCTSLKSATEYPCSFVINCALGQKSKQKSCPMRETGECTYSLQKKAFLGSKVAITNYPYLLAERAHIKALVKRKLLVCDEAQGLEKQIIGSVDIVLNNDQLEKWGLLARVPPLGTLTRLIEWMETNYVQELKDRAEAFVAIAENDDKMIQEANRINGHLDKVTRAIEHVKKDPTDWVYWQETNQDGKLESIARPLSSAPFANMILDAGHVKLYMSAYPGDKKTFCENIGIHADEMAWASFSSPFDPKNRPVCVISVGSMGLKSIADTAPRLIKVATQIATKHANEKGIIHSNSYKVANLVYNGLANSDHRPRLIYPRKADERDLLYKQHLESDRPTILISPSISEGFDFKDDSARWQIIAKCPFLSLGNKQTMAKKDRSEMWYVSETIKTVIQACGRICRNEKDHGITYILDTDFQRLWVDYPSLFPKWFKEAVVFPKR